jgi:DNA-binding CsgD family transcriptional regulator
MLHVRRMPIATHHERVLSLIGEVIGLLELDEFRPGLVHALRAAVPADWIALNDVGATPESTVVLIEPEFSPAEHQTFARHAGDNPLLERYRRTGDGRAYRFSDVTTPERLQATALYREFYGPIGLKHQIAFTLPHEPDRVLALSLSRRDQDFSDEERALLDEARPFLIQSYQNAFVHSRLEGELERQRSAPELPVDEPRLAERLSEQGVTRREAQVLAVIAAGFSDRAAAQLMGISERTVQKHLQRCYRKLGVHSREEAVDLAWVLAGDRRRLG